MIEHVTMIYDMTTGEPQSLREAPTSDIAEALRGWEHRQMQLGHILAAAELRLRELVLEDLCGPHGRSVYVIHNLD